MMTCLNLTILYYRLFQWVPDLIRDSLLQQALHLMLTPHQSRPNAPAHIVCQFWTALYVMDTNKIVEEEEKVIK